MKLPQNWQNRYPWNRWNVNKTFGQFLNNVKTNINKNGQKNCGLSDIIPFDIICGIVQLCLQYDPAQQISITSLVHFLNELQDTMIQVSETSNIVQSAINNYDNYQNNMPNEKIKQIRELNCLTRLTFGNIAQFVEQNSEQESNVVVVGKRTFSWLKLIQEKEQRNKNGKQKNYYNNNTINTNKIENTIHPRNNKNISRNGNNNTKIVQTQNQQHTRCTQTTKMRNIQTQTGRPLFYNTKNKEIEIKESENENKDEWCGLTGLRQSQNNKFTENIDPNMTIANSVEALPFVNKANNLDLTTTPNKKQEEKLKMNENYTNFHNHLIVFEFSQLSFTYFG